MKGLLHIGLHGRLFLLLMVPVAILGTLIVEQGLELRQERLRFAHEQLLHEARVIAARQQHLAARAEAILNEITQSSALQAGAGPDTCNAWLAARLQPEGEFVNLGTLTPDGDVECAAVPPAGPLSFADRNWFKSAVRTRRMIIGDVVQGRILGKPVITLAKAARGEQGELQKVYFVTLDLAWLRAELAKAGLPEGAHLGVVDADGTIVARLPDRSRWTGRNAADQPMIRALHARNGEGTLEEIGLDGQRKIVAVTPLLTTVSGDLRMWLALPREAVTSPSREELAAHLGFGFVLLTALLALAFWGGDRILLRPLKALAAAADRLGAGDFRARSGLAHGDDEIGRLARAFDQAAANIMEQAQARQVAEAALSDNAERLELLIDHAPVALALLDRDMRYLAVSKRWRDDYSLGERELLGRSHYEIFPKLPERWKEAHRRALAGEVIPAYDDYLVRTDGGQQWLRRAIHPWRTHDGSVGGIVIFSEDITGRRQALASLLESERRFSATFEQAAVGIAHVATDGRWLRVNRKLCSIIGYTPEELLTKTFQDVTHPNDVAADLDLRQRTLAREIDSYALQKRYFRKDGAVVWVNLSVSLVWTPDNTPDYFIAVMEDITEKKIMSAEIDQYRAGLERLVEQRTAQLRELQHKAEAANVAKSAFLANMSHEIRTPMNAILGLAYLLAKADLPAEAHGLVQKIRSSGRTLQGIINDILDFSKIEAGRLEIEQAPFRLGDVLDSLATIMAANAGSKDIELVISPPPPSADALVGDALRLEQVLINLTGNAIKFTEQGHVHVDIDVVAEAADAITLRFAVADTGIGISGPEQQVIFGAFSQADSSTTRRFGGSGLGLAICRQLVALMGGEIGVRSEPGQGSEFWFTLTLAQAREIRFASQSMGRKSLLIADDNAIARRALRRTATQLGWTSRTVESGEAAVECALAPRASRGTDEVIILDWQMPGMGGLGAARAIREAASDGADPIVIMVTAHSREALLALPESALVDAVLTKPVTASTLHDAVADALRKRNGESSQIAAPGADSRRLEGMRILVVDDSDINRDVARWIFTDEGARVSLAGDGREALGWLQTHPDEVDIVLMDVQMPGLDGYEATRAIRTQLALNDLPVVALTAGAFKEQKDAAVAAGMDDFIAKPFDVDACIALIRKLTRWDERAIEAVPALELAAMPAARPMFPGLDVEAGLALWRDPSVYQQYLAKFAAEYADISRAIAQSPPAEARALAHRLRGVAANLALRDVAAAASELEHELQAGTVLPASTTRLQSATDAALGSIERYAALAPAKPISGARIEDPAQAARLLRRALRACDSDNPDEIERLLDLLAPLLSRAQLAPLRTAVENFDFRGSEALVRKLLAEFGMPMED